MHTSKRRGRSRSRILYWFRTPPGVRVGRAALDEDAIRLIEERNPDLEFDWTKILKAQQEVPPEPKPYPNDRRARPRGREFPAQPGGPRRFEHERRRKSDLQPRVEIGEPSVPPQKVPDSPVPEPAMQDDAMFASGAAEPEALGEAEAVTTGDDITAEEIVGAEAFVETDREELLEEVPANAQPQIPVVRPVDMQFDEPATTGPIAAAQVRLGSEGLGRLRARHAEVLARISEKIADPVRRDELKSQAERLNPDTWVTDAEVTAGLESYEAVFEALRGVIGRRRKRRRSRGRGAASSPVGESMESGTDVGGADDVTHASDDAEGEADGDSDV